MQPFFHLTPGTRTGIIRDGAFEDLCRALADVERALLRIIAEQRQAEEERASRKMLNTIQKAFKEALLALPAEEYDSFDIQKGSHSRKPPSPTASDGIPATDAEADGAQNAATSRLQKQFFEFAGPLFAVRVSRQSSVVPVGQSRTYRATARDRSRHVVERDLTFQWKMVEGAGELHNAHSEILTFTAPEQPGLTRINVSVAQGVKVCEAEGIITITDTLLPDMQPPPESRQGLPGYTFRKAPGELWRSRYDTDC